MRSILRFARGAAARPAPPNHDACRHLLPRGSPAREPAPAARPRDSVVGQDPGGRTPDRGTRGLRAACRGRALRPPIGRTGTGAASVRRAADRLSRRTVSAHLRPAPRVAGTEATAHRDHGSPDRDGGSRGRGSPGHGESQGLLAYHRPQGRRVLKGLVAADVPVKGDGPEPARQLAAKTPTRIATACAPAPYSCSSASPRR